MSRAHSKNWFKNWPADILREKYEKFPKDVLELEYSPSRHVPNTDSALVISDYITTVQTDIATCRNSIPFRSIEFRAEECKFLSLDLYGEDLPKGSPLFVFVHGGYWQELNKDLVGGLMGPLHRAGIMTAVLPYTTAPSGKVSAMVEEIHCGMVKCCEVLRERGGDTMVVSGWSAGAQLVLQALLKTKSEENEYFFPSLKGILTISGVFDLIPLVNTYVNEPLQLSVCDASTLSPVNQANCLALKNIMPADVRIVIAVAEHDSDQFKQQSHVYAQCLRLVGFQEVEEMVIKKSDHFKIITNLANTSDILMKTLIQIIKPKNCSTE